MLAILLTAGATCAGLGAIAADRPERRHPGFYLLKPLATVLLLATALSLSAHGGGAYQQLIAAGLAFALAGDILLMKTGNAAFAAGLGAFLAAHLIFLAAFLHGVEVQALPLWVWPMVAYALLLGTVLVRRAGRLRWPVAAYVLALSAMAAAAGLRAEALPGTQPLLALAGALLFVLSDSALGVRRFLRPYPGDQALILGTYWAGIGLIAWSV